MQPKFSNVCNQAMTFTKTKQTRSWYCRK